MTPAVLLQNSQKITRQERLAVECLKSKYQGPCKMFQRRKCVKRKNTERGMWKMVRCRGNHANNFLMMDLQLPSISNKNDVLDDSGSKCNMNSSFPYPYNLRRTPGLSLKTHFQFFEGPIVSYGDENGNCKCPDGHNILELEDIEYELTSARSERRRQRAFLKKHTTMGIDTFENDKTRTYHNQHVDYLNDSRSNLHGTAHTDRVARIKRQSELSSKNVEAISGDQLHQNPEVRHLYTYKKEAISADSI